MAVHLVGGGGSAEPWAPFVAEATVRAGRAPDVVVITVGARTSRHARDLVRAMGDVRPRILAVGQDADLADDVLDGAHGVVVGGGPTPAYLAVLLPLGRRLRELVADGVPYAGFSAGAMIAGRRAVLGGWRLGGVPVCRPDAAEDLDELVVADGLGLVGLAVDPHAVQQGTPTRLVAAVGAGLVPLGVAIDDDTAVVVDGDATRVVGRGAAWFAAPGDAGRVLVERRTA